MKTEPLITLPGGEAYYLPGTGDQCAVLVHGYTGTPGELRLLGEYLNKLGLAVLGVRLPGHGTSVKDLEHTTFADWYEEVLKNVAKARTFSRKVSLIGSSMGGAVVLKVCAHTQIYKAVVMSAPVETYNSHYKYANLFHFFHPTAKKPPRQFDVPSQYYQSYNEFPLLPLSNAFKEISKIKEKSLPLITCPFLIMQSTVEKHVKPESAQIIYDSIASKEKDIVWYHHSGHLLALDAERLDVYKRIGVFLTTEPVLATTSSNK